MSDRVKDSELHIAKTFYEEANKQQAIKNKNFNEVAKQKLEHAVKQTKECSNKRVELDKNKETP